MLILTSRPQFPNHKLMKTTGFASDCVASRTEHALVVQRTLPTFQPASIACTEYGIRVTKSRLTLCRCCLRACRPPRFSPTGVIVPPAADAFQDPPLPSCRYLHMDLSMHRILGPHTHTHTYTETKKKTPPHLGTVELVNERPSSVTGANATTTNEDPVHT